MFVIASTTNNDVRKENTNFMKELNSFTALNHKRAYAKMEQFK